VDRLAGSQPCHRRAEGRREVRRDGLRAGVVGESRRRCERRERVMAGVDCGFSVHAGSNSLDPEIVWAKLAALAQGAAIASERYW